MYIFQTKGPRELTLNAIKQALRDSIEPTAAFMPETKTTT